MTDLTTTYMGLALANPLVPSASPSRAAWTTCAGWRTPGGRWCCTPCSRSRSRRAVSWTTSWSRGGELRRGPDLLPPAGGLRPDAGALPGPRAAGQGRRGHPGHREPQRGLRGGWVRYAREIEQAGADALELNVYHVPTDPRMGSAEVEQYVDLLLAVRQQVRIPVAVKLSPSSPTWRCWPTGWTTPGRTPWCCSTASTSRTSTWSHWRWCPVRPSAGRTPCACPCAGSPSSTAGWPRTSRHQRHPLRRGRPEGPAGGGQRHHAGLGAAGQRDRPPDRHPARPPGLVGGARVRLGGAAAGEHEPAGGGLPRPSSGRTTSAWWPTPPRRSPGARSASPGRPPVLSSGRWIDPGGRHAARSGTARRGVAGQLRPHPCPAPPAPCVLRAPSLQEAPITLSRLPGRPPWAGHPGRGGARWPAPSPTAARRR